MNQQCAFQFIPAIKQCVCGSGGDKTGQTVQICTTKRGLGEICDLTTASQQLLRMYLFAIKVRATNQCKCLSTFPLENDPKLSLDSYVHP